MTRLLPTLSSHYRRHPVQGLFLLTGITVANVLLVGTLLINAQARASYARGEAMLKATPVAEIRHRDSGQAIDEGTYFQLRRQGFDMLVPVLRRVLTGANGDPLELVGIDPFAMPRSADNPLMAGVDGFVPALAEFAFPPYQLWAAPARMRQLGAGDGVQLALASGAVLPPLRTLHDRDLGHRLLLDIGALQSLSGSKGRLSALWVFEAPPDRLAALQAALPPSLLYMPAADAPDPAELTRSFHLNLAAMGLLAFVVGVFLTYNAIAFSYTDRRELMRNMRLSGVTQGEMAAALLAELALFLGAGGLLGAWLGARTAAWLLPGVGQTLAQLYGVHIAYPDGLTIGGSLLPLLMTVSAAFLCVAFPLREALRMPLLRRRQGGWQMQEVLRRDLQMLAAGTLLLIGAGLLAWLANSLSQALAGMACLLVGAVLWLPAVLRLLLGAADRIVPRRSAQLAWMLADSRWLLGPASLALMALTLALVANSGLNTMIGSFRQATDNWLQQRLVAQLYLRGLEARPALDSWLAANYPDIRVSDRYRTELARPARAGATASGGTRIEVISLQTGQRFLDGVRLLRPGDDARRRFQAGEGVFISERAWRLDGWQQGGSIWLCERVGEAPVLGVYHDYGNPLSQLMVSEGLFRKCWPDLRPVSQALFGPPSANWADLRAMLPRDLGLRPEQMVDTASLKQAGLAVFDRTFVVTRALNSLTLLVAGIGLFCAISAIHHHRIGQQALLAALGMTRRERSTLLLMQWGLLGVLCMAVVWPFGTVLAAYLAAVVTPIAFGWSFPLRFELAHYPVLAALASACLLGAVAFPSWRLLRASPARLLREQAL